MRFEVKTGSTTKLKTACLILPIYSSGSLPASTQAVDKATGGLISQLIDAGDISGKTGTSMLVRVGDSIVAERMLLVGCGKKAAFDRKQYRKVMLAAFTALGRTQCESAISCVSLESIKGADFGRRARIAAEVWQHASYRYTTTKPGSQHQATKIETLGLAANSQSATAMRAGLKQGQAIGAGMNVSRELGNLPANICTPSHLVADARRLAKNDPALTVEVLSEANMKKLGMGALLSVTAGTNEPAKLIVMHYNGAAKTSAPVALVGKGVTFDTGGISLKPGGAMDEMKFDMCGAATVLGCMHAISSLGLKINVVGVVPACENMPSSTATKPGDVVTAMSGKTIEILNTDAEGRLILADALTYVQKFNPRVIIDMATLTGACLVALGRHRSGLLSNSNKLANALGKAGDNADDPVWRLPLDPEYRALLKSNFADLANIGGRDAGTITAACFLAEFVGDYDWAHLDIAGTAWWTGGRKGSTGRPIPLLMEYLLNHA